MSGTYLNYDLMLQGALRAVVRDALTQIAARGVLGNHHFYITFKTGHEGVDIPEYLHAQYPDEMTIVLQHQFSGLEVEQDFFSVTLSFNKVPARLIVPFAAVARFADPPANFGLQLMPGETPEAPPAAPPQPALETPPAEGTAKIVALDSFRKS
jgi:uncharacterized protein